MTTSEISHWWTQLYAHRPDLTAPRPRLEQAREADVCIVGAGYTGLWTALELLRAKPGLDVVVLDAHVAGFGASGRNGGAVIAQMNGSRDYWMRHGGRQAAIDMERAIQRTVEEVGIAIAREEIECGYGKNGVIMVARSPMEEAHFRHSVEEDREWGFTEEDSRYLSAEELSERMVVERALGARFSPHCASIDPARLVRGLALAVERLGGAVYENSPVEDIVPGIARTSRAEVRARHVIRTTEAYTESIRSARRRLVPIATSMLATEPIPEATWARIGWQNREALLGEHPFLHLQHTTDRRITIGGADNRVPYRFGSKVEPAGAAVRRVHDMYYRELIGLFPALAGIGVAQSWNGAFATTRNWAPGVDLDRATGLGWAGGYVGEGVAAANLAGRTMRDLILGEDTELTRLPWVGVAARRWEPEPLRMVGSQIVWATRAIGARNEVRTQKRSKLVGLANRLVGFSGSLGG